MGRRGIRSNLGSQFFKKIKILANMDHLDQKKKKKFLAQKLKIFLRSPPVDFFKFFKKIIFETLVLKRVLLTPRDSQRSLLGSNTQRGPSLGQMKFFQL